MIRFLCRLRNHKRLWLIKIEDMGDDEYSLKHKCLDCGDKVYSIVGPYCKEWSFWKNMK